MLDEPQAVLRKLSVRKLGVRKPSASVAVQLKSPVVHDELGARFDVIGFENKLALQRLDDGVVKCRTAHAARDPRFQILHL